LTASATAGPLELFWIWFAANISVLGMFYGLALVALSSLATQAILARLGVGGGKGQLAVAFVVVAAATIVVGLLGHATIVKLMTWLIWVFAALTVVFFVLQLGQVDWDKVAALPSGDLLAGVVGGASVVAAGLGVGWINAAADYSRYLPQRASSGAIVGWTVLGASLGPVLLIAFGVLLAANNDQLAGSANLLGALAEPLPTWFLVPYLLVAVGGLLAGAVIDMYSSGLNLLTLGVRLPRYQSVLIDGAIMLAGNIYILFFAPDFVGPFQGFLITLGVPLAAWGPSSWSTWPATAGATATTTRPCTTRPAATAPSTRPR
jgi:NCS1 family nucleobase:cation symporter-1